jgi:hypothetical protein
MSPKHYTPPGTLDPLPTIKVSIEDYVVKSKVVILKLLVKVGRRQISNVDRSIDDFRMLHDTIAPKL